MKHFLKIAEGIVTVGVLSRLVTKPELWNEDTTRTGFDGSPHSQVSDIILRCCDTVEQGLAEAYSDIEAEDRDVMKEFPAVKQMAFAVMQAVSGSRLGRVVITRLPAGGRIAPHVDEGPYPAYYQRYAVVLQGLPGSLYRCGDETINMLTGEVWWTDVKTEHEVINNSKDDRIHLLVDVHLDH